ncbi:hypothetical protein FSP39_017962 [Pinctada imbricata]|uniref:Uncharacterized protein n=1 Tax=Pinctada imbricata TaxID=66713 RepID=A0AA88XX90_PINIB|nr:hypothetical protein FSP39_017962 [Pinctada imbricata]
MESEIQPLPVEVKSLLRSGVALTSVTQCVEELVLNAIDAGATCIAVRVDMSLYKVQVLDNGCGMSAAQLKSVGGRYHTSKCHGVGDLNNLCYYGYRGEALASFREICSVLEIVSRDKSSSISYCKMFQKGRSLPVIESTVPRPSKGTTVTAHDMFHNLPVRRKSTNESLEFERVRQRLEAIALVQPDISISLRNDVTGNVVLQTQKVNSILKTFTTLFGKGKGNNMKRVENESAQYKVEAYISTDTSSRKDHQFVYVNKRHVLKTEIHKSMNYLLGKSVLLKTKSQPSTYNASKSESPTKPSDRYGIFVLCLTCPYDEYDITFEPAKTLIQFKHWMDLRNCIEEMVMGFLRQENLLSVGQMLELNQKDYPKCNNKESKRTDLEKEDVRNGHGNGDDEENTESLNGRNSSEGNSEIDKCSISTHNIRKSLSSKCVSRVAKSVNERDQEPLEENGDSQEHLVTENGHSETSGMEFQNCLPDQVSEKERKEMIDDQGNSFCTPQKCVIKQREVPPSPKQRRRSLETPLPDANTPESEYESESPLSTKCSSCSKQNKEPGMIKMPTPLVGPSGISSLSLFKKRYQTRESLKNRFANTRILNVEAKNSRGLKTSVTQSHDEDKDPSTTWKIVSERGSHSAHKKGIGDFRKRLLQEVSNVNSKHLKLEQTKEDDEDTGNSGICDLICHEKMIPVESKKIVSSAISSTRNINLHVDDADKGNSGISDLICHEEIDPTKIQTKEIVSSATSSTCDLTCHEDMLLDETDARENRSFATCDLICNEKMNFDEQKLEQRQENKGCSSTSELICYEDMNFDDQKERLENRDCSTNRDLICHEDMGVEEYGTERNMSSASCDLLCHEDFSSSVAAAESSTNSQRLSVKQSLSSQESNHAIQETQNFIVSSQGFLVSETCQRDDVSMITSSPDHRESSGENSCPFSRFVKEDVIHLLDQKDFPLAWNDVDMVPSQSDDILHQMEDLKCYESGNVEKEPDELNLNLNSLVQETLGEDMGQPSPIMMSISRFVDEDESDKHNHSTGAIVSEKVPSPDLENDKLLPKSSQEETDHNEENLSSNTCLSDSESAKEISQVCSSTVAEARQKDISINVDSRSIIEDNIEDKDIQESGKNSVDDLCSQWSDVSDEQMLGALRIRPNTPSQNGETEVLKTKATTSCDSVVSAKHGNSSEKMSLLSSCNMDMKSSDNSQRHNREDCESGNMSTENSFCDTEINGTVNRDEKKLEDETTSIGDSDSGQYSSSGKAEKPQLWVKMTAGRSVGEVYVNTMTGHTMKDPDFIPPQVGHTDGSPESIEEDRTQEESHESSIKPLTPTSHSALLSMIEDGFDDDEDVKTVKWKDGKPGSTQSGKTVEDLLEMWDNPVFNQPEKEVMSAEVSRDKGMGLLKAHHVCNPLKFTKDMLQSYKVLGQVDNKFIACLLNSEKSQNQKDIYKEEENGDNRVIKSTCVNPAKVLMLPEEYVQIMSSFQKEFNKIGVSFHIYKKERDKIVVDEIPECIAKMETNETKMSSSIVVWDLVEMLKSTKGATRIIPQTIHKMLCSQACHGAIKFGDPLTLKECESLLSGLSTCKLPFQCAHGRPSVMPILHADQLNNRNERRPPPNLWKLHKSMQEDKVLT